MATAFGPEMVIDRNMSSMTAVERQPTRHIPEMLSLDTPVLPDSTYDNAAASPRKMPPSPLPAFVFPAKAPSSAPPSMSRATGRRTRSAIDLSNSSEQLKGSIGSPLKLGRPAALPSFSFNPGANLTVETTTTLLSPPMSPQTPSPRSIPSPSRPGGHGHRRGGSEFVGGSIRTGDSITVTSTSPTKSESGMASPGFAPPSLGEPPAAASRRHRHRRSAAISSHDLSLILQPTKPTAALRGSSAPNSPADFGGRRLGDSPSEPEIPPMPPLTPDLTPSEAVPPPFPKAEEKTPEPTLTPRAPRPVPRARVGFSDTLEFIPRPLSLVSSDASSTATARPGGHSVSGSLSSIISATEEVEKPVVEEKQTVAPLRRSSTSQSLDSRPSTAGAVLERSQSIQAAQLPNGSPRRRNSIPTLSALPSLSVSAEPSPTKTPKRWSFFGLEPFTAAQMPPRPRETSAGSAESVSKTTADSASTASEHQSDSAADTSDAGKARDGGDKSSKKKKKKRKVKAWAGSILKGKPKANASKKSKDAAVPVILPADMGTAESEEAVKSTQPEALPSPATPTVTVTDTSPAEGAQSWKTRSSSTPEDDTSFSMIDLDAALGPFNTPLPHNAEWEAAQKAAGPGHAATRRQLHSAQGLKGFSGPGMHYHRRAESAPEMVPFEAARFGMNRFGSSSTMADVFEEDEEYDDDDAKTTASQQASQTTSKDVSTAPSESGDDDETPPATTPKDPLLDVQPTQTKDTDRSLHAPSMKSERSMASLQDQVILEEPRAVEFRTESLFQAKVDQGDRAAPSPRRAPVADLAPVEIAPLALPTPSHIPVSPYSVSPGSSFPSPRSPMSYDAHRISTAPSSVNEENTFQSLLLGEPGPELRLSVDIPPSLTSSNSTMTRDSTFLPGPQPRARMPHRPDERPVSVGSAAFGRRRSSLASLSRLISSSHGERSKLSMEVSCDMEADKKQKTSKAKRLSRMMQFWKPSKEESTT